MPARDQIRAWALPALLAAAFVLVGALKLLDPAGTATFFEGFGYPAGFGLVVGVAEVAGGLLQLAPQRRAFGARLRFWGACMLATIMVGAVTTMLIHGGLTDILLPLGLGLVAGRVAWASLPPAPVATAQPKGADQHA